MQFSKESLFKSSFRAFFVSFSTILGIAVALALGIAALALFADRVKKPEKSELLVSQDADGNRSLLDDSAPVLLKISLHGIIGEGALQTEKIENLLLDAEEEPLKKDRVKGVLLSINTPGGTSSDSDGIFRALKAYKAKHRIPVYVFVDGLCASGGMYISAVADQIYATSSSVVGSIGVLLGPAFNFSKAMEKLGVESVTLTDGKNKDMLNPFRPWKDGEDASLKEIVASDYARFVNHMTTARPRLDKEKLIQVYGAQVFDASKGQELGYVDVAGATYRDALASLAKAAGIEGDKKYQVFEIKATESFVKELLESNHSLLKGRIIHSFETGSLLKPEMSGKMLYLYPGLIQ
ncbi:MAG: hypothetical protein A2Y28_03315 [Chlamydiae bacterium GWC2_50_10]|nr:MAG: hypothetical protein A2Z85_01750 [Chlamydiae bacterium GWA2_50_15]OGN54283.1 MAG: hypothetical protein A2Y28_03315 [Chlamydiae bacterium GWC2_50_10]OGN55522.1 MAG: hypothetical protein A2098_01075 [Chlamydiae bacterium GWF2_49_8]OGN58865.1 MAG: hypothetical protein A3D18_03580 [Chlamydiae bacterium RIFCSPHIGHO2_02_FULL_49_29]OGN62560.1 MAG: hypothetical protein A3E26_01315 [Chlamydiae bacterium RIFCSPHIGHO2_12_FULL_49_32]OGN68415.1 MAG: hypothetical protein A3I15_04545 [Chlamydiae bact